MDIIQKYKDPYITRDGKERAYVDLNELKTLWFNTGSRCNLECENCYIESSPKNDRLAYIDLEDVTPFLDEIKEESYPVELIGLTGGEPFLNPSIIEIITEILKRDIEVLVLTNAYNIINRKKDDLRKIREFYGDKLHIRVSLDHFSKEFHEQERGKDTFDKTLVNIKWLYENSFNVSIAGRHLKDESFELAKNSYGKLLEDNEISINLNDNKLVVFPEMDLNAEVPEITTECWGILNKTPQQQMCSTERMIVKRKGDQKAAVLPCTLLAYDDQFIMGTNLKDSKKRVQLNHKFCAQFCVLGGASCSSAK